jgi:hypothetical protein
LNLKSIQIQTPNLFLLLNLFPKLNTSLGSFSFSCSLQPAQPAPNRGPPNLALSLLSFSRRQPGPASQPADLTHPHLFPSASDSHRSGRLAPRPRARMGWPGAELARTPRPARVRTTQTGESAKGKAPFCPCPVTPKEAWPPLVWSHVGQRAMATNSVTP